MTIDEMRKYYPFLCYGNEYARLRNAALYYKYLLDRITTERHASQVGHDWNKWSASLYVAWKEHRKLLAKLPKPTKEQIKDEDDPNYPWTEGKWPEGETCQPSGRSTKATMKLKSALTMLPQF